jgi:biotin synthase
MSDLSRRELERLVIAVGPEAEDLHARADDLRRRTVGDEAHLRGIIEFSNYCFRDCLYCGLRASNRGLLRYRMEPIEIVEAAEVGARLGLGTVVLQSGEDLWWTADRLAQVISDIRCRTALAVTLAVGEREDSEYEAWRRAGADRYLLKFETSDPGLYARLHPGASFENRIRCLETLRGLGYQIGSGCIVGLPGQTPRILADNLLLLRRLGVHMAGIGPLIPHPDTPLAEMRVGPADVTLNMVALLRLLVPDVMEAATTALETAVQGGRLAALKAGANVIMPNITPRKYASFYEIYPGKKAPTISVEEEVERARRVVAEAGRTVASGPGHSPRLAQARP